ncbi:heterogeneous nuclear ribonucleoprotein D-like isoform X1 [Lingula anatina]|uniref:Heterogeneous nuclear ribonucleoprotein D-like isoform X1 n=1 Tax=Lingula anatina TaxID=7574 RepID=A0A1S3HBZ5_LINAN|nr:heterogeneous nuclear ribonucleoprotein D-like isoform X2 [Lingula anatina]XP_023933354.1 heterogeneous nuclear ribonucleoprotein D-like isoform X1 [Lingula anatina]|eukprot:XP_013383515.1 heterogeneous nuclear ribonucleoprotein D-like isoform X2 [Lingula anatina]
MADTELTEQTGAQYDAAQEKYGGEENNDDDRKLFVGGLSLKATTEDLRDYFGKFGEVADCTVKTDVYSGRSRGFGSVVFKDSSGMEAVLSYKEDHVIQGKTIEAKRAVPESGSDSYSRKKIFVGGLSQNISKEDLRVYFSEFGKVEDIFLPLDSSTGEGKGFCFITFESAEVVDKILENPSATIGGKVVDVKRSKANEERRGGGRGGFRGYGGRGRGRGGRDDNGGGYGGYNQGYEPNQGYGGYNQGYGGYNQYGGANNNRGFGGNTPYRGANNNRGFGGYTPY